MNKPPVWTRRVNEFFAQDFFQRVLYREWVLGLVVFAALSAILVTNLVPARVNVSLGQVSKRDIEASRTIVDTVGTEKQQEDAIRRVVETLAQDRANYVINPTVGQQALGQVDAVFEKIRSLRLSKKQGAADENQASGQASPTFSEAAVDGLQKEIAQDEGVILTSESLRSVLKASDEVMGRAQGRVESVVESLFSNERVDEETLSEAKRKADELLSAPSGSSELADFSSQLVRSVIRPNMFLDPVRLRDAQARAVRSVEPIRILKGQTIVRRGDVITADHLRILKALGLQRADVNYLSVLGVIAVALLLTAGIGVYLHVFHAEILASESLLALLGLIVVVLAFVAKILSTLTWPGAGYVIPIAFGTMLATILLDSRLAIMVAVLLAVVVGIVTGFDLKFTLLALVGGVTGVFSVSKVSQRGDLMRAGMIVGAVNFGFIVSLGLATGDMGVVQSSYLGVVNGIVSSIFAIGSLAYLEMLFGITSAIKLLELSNPNHPLLKRLLVEAPGTYHHSIMVGNLAEAAAEAVAGDPLLARVGAYYHDIGKVKRPYFFAENQVAADNPHDKIAPGLSTLIITTHVKDGVELAKDKKLPEVLVDFIRQHHGTDLVRYFYHRAMANAKEELSERDFRYTGPKPQSKETAIVMLADSVEAAVRGIQKPTPGRIEGMVRKLIKDRLTDGQLDECNLTLRDLDTIANAFVRVFAGMFHTRIEYPEKLLKEIENRKG